MENIKNESGKEDNPLEKFRLEIKQLAEFEKAEGKTVHLSDIGDTDQLTEEDFKMWKLLNTDWQQAWKEIGKYKNSIRNDEKTRSEFAAFLSNMIMRKYSEELKSKNHWLLPSSMYYK